MFKQLNPDCKRTLSFSFDGQTITATPQDTVATALLAAGHLEFRRTIRSDTPRGPFCMMGSCFECLVEIDGQTRRQACLEPVEEGMQVRSAHGVAE